jgi:transposase InsO family protein
MPTLWKHNNRGETRYAGQNMPISSALPGALALSRLPYLSKEARVRLAWMDWYRAHGKNASLTCRHFGISRQVFHKWRKLFDPHRLESLESRSRRPRKMRGWEVSRTEEFRILRLRKAHIRYGKMKLQVLYEEEYGEAISSWKIQRVIEKHGLYFHPAKAKASSKRRKAGQKKKRITELEKKQRNGFLVALDTVVRHPRSQRRYILTGIDTHSKIAFVRMYPTKHSRHAADFLLRLRYLFDGQIENLQTDNGSEFEGAFREAAEKLCLQHWHSRVRTPTDNPFDERFNRTLDEEFLQMGGLTDDCDLFNRRVTEWLVEYNFRRPHQSLDYLTPVAYHAGQAGVSPMWPSNTLS